MCVCLWCSRRHDHLSPGPLSVLAPFTTTLWVLLLCTVFAVSLLFWLLDAYGRCVGAVRQGRTAAQHGMGCGLRKGVVFALEGLASRCGAAAA